jgi:molybdate transport system ATP-binding protein
MNKPLIEFDNVDVCLDGQPVLSDVSWRLLKAEHWAVFGGNGAGKTTLLKLIRGEIAPRPRKGCRIYRLGVPQRTAVGIKEQMPLVSPEAQDRYLQLEWKRRADEVIFSGFGGADYLHSRPTKQQREMAAQLSEQFGVAHLWHRNVQELSTGELRRVLIARALVRRPPVLLLDEACDGLDGPTRRLLLDALNCVARSGTQIIYTTHRTEEFIPALTHALVLENGRIAWKGDVGHLRGNAGRRKRVNQSLRTSAATKFGGAKSLIRIAGANVFLERRLVLREVVWELQPGENWAILGANGSGKTTFLKLVCGDLHPACGGLVKRFEFTSRHTLWDIRKRIGFVSPALQANYRQQLNGAEVVASGFFSSIGLMRRVTRKQQRRIDALVEEFDAKRLAATSVLRMSYGEFRKMLLLRALVHNPAVVACDEPFDGLDCEAKGTFCAALDRVASNGTRLITVTHHINELPRSTTHALVLEKGRIVCQGELERVRRHPAARRLFDHESYSTRSQR